MSYASLSMDDIIELARSTQTNVPAYLIVKDVLVLFVKTEAYRASEIKNSSSVTVEVSVYSGEVNGISIIIAPYSNTIFSNMESEYLNYAVAGFVPLNKKENIKILRDVANNKAEIQFYVVSEDLNTISIKKVLTNSISKEDLLRKLNKHVENDFDDE
ncbi:hypothetical protein BC351_14885 [Paenibacillus ferrarius]|uniref:Uncharacterized protein n=1 Tax=Paenibacillus ferrarius TaxID=1469647 RepID=A0A1V4HRE4_9BACL|nr:hypothetical protein [Paenibacillus ferrarius]OPH61225.1 hypothetical protein BC351_14885 [Paenibacillus ferrarius]